MTDASIGNIREYLILPIFGLALFYTIALALVTYIGVSNGNASLILSIINAGILGGFISSLMRINSYDDKALQNLSVNKKTLLIQSLIPVFLGAVFALILHLVFAAHLLSGDFFPSFNDYQSKGFTDFIKNYRPAESVDYAKCLVWGFIAGFSERFVPDVLGRIVSSTKQKKRTGAAN